MSKVIRYISIQRSIDKEPHLGELMVKGVAGEISALAAFLYKYGAEDVNTNYYRRETPGIYHKLKIIVTFKIDQDMFDYLKEDKLGSYA